MTDATPQHAPSPDALDTAELVGLPVSVEIDPERINVPTEAGAVTRIEGVGGGL